MDTTMCFMISFYTYSDFEYLLLREQHALQHEVREAQDLS